MRDLVGDPSTPAGPCAASSARCSPSPAAARLLLLLSLLVIPAVGGCAPGPRVVPADQTQTIDRTLVEYPAGYELRPYIRNLTAPSAVTFDDKGNILIAESGAGNTGVRIYGFRPDGTRFDIHPKGTRRLPALLKFLDRPKFTIVGPVGGIAYHDGKVYVSHRDGRRLGRITALDYDGNPTTIIAGLPAQGDYSVTDIAIDPRGRLFFGVGAATNSGVVGLDNWQAGWVRDYPTLHDQPHTNLVLRGLRFDTPNPLAGLFSGAEIAVTGPFQPFDVSNRIRVHRARDGQPNAAIYSIPATGGGPADLRVVATGIRLPRGLAFNEFGRLYATNNGMELRGTRPVKDDPDALLRVIPGTWYGWPDFSADLYPVNSERFEIPADMLDRISYFDAKVAFLIDHQASGLVAPDMARDTLLQSAFPSQSGAAKMTFIPGDGPLADWRGSVIVALAGDRAPFATSGRKLVARQGFKLMRVDVDSRQAHEFIRNTAGVPRHLLPERPEDALERPVDVKVGPDGALYIVDMGRVDYRNGREHVAKGTGQIFRLAPPPPPPTPAATEEPAAEPAPTPDAE